MTKYFSLRLITLCTLQKEKSGINTIKCMRDINKFLLVNKTLVMHLIYVFYFFNSLIHKP